MQKQIFDLVNQYNAALMTSFKQLGDLNMKAMERFANTQAEAINQCVEAGSKHMEDLSKAKDLTEAFAMQSAYSQNCGEKMMANARVVTEMMEEVRDGLSEIAESTTSTLVKKMEEAGEVLKDAA